MQMPCQKVVACRQDICEGANSKRRHPQIRLNKEKTKFKMVPSRAYQPPKARPAINAFLGKEDFPPMLTLGDVRRAHTEKLQRRRGTIRWSH
jgi:hypothetical protein